MSHRRFHEEHEHLGHAFGQDLFGQLAEKFARFFGTPSFIIGQTFLVFLWVILNTVAWFAHWDEYPFILLNLAFSTQAAYAAPLILLAQTRQADRDKIWSDADSRHREEISTIQMQLLEENTRLTQAIHELTQEIHARH